MKIDLIEQMNAYGPYDHGVWKMQSEEGELINFGTQSLFASRAEKMVETIVHYLTKTFSATELENFSILDVGCYDGWVLTQICKRIKFRKAVGLEPRQKNIDKGVFARSVTGEKTNCEFVLGAFEDLVNIYPKESFDIVLCLGLLHHTNSVENAITKITRKCSKLLIVDSMIIPELVNDIELIAAVVNPVDIVYRNREQVWSIAAYKYESPYFDGSTADADIVNIPQERLIKMCLNSVKFSKFESLMSEKDFYPKEYQSLRGVSEVMFAAFKDQAGKEDEEGWREDAKGYELLYTCYIPSEPFLCYLYQEYKDIAALQEIFIRVLDKEVLERAVVSPESLVVEEKELLSAIPRSPFEKIVLELAKYCIDKKELGEAKSLLLLVTRTKNADWRSFYRACFLLYKINSSFKLVNDAKKYKELLFVSNPQFPCVELESLCKF